MADASLLGGSFGALRENTLRLLKDLDIKGDKYLDLGCSDGDFTTQVATEIKARELYGIDVSADSVRHASEKGVKALCLDLNCGPLPFSDNSFDLISAIEVIEHLTDTDRFLSEVHRCLRKGGYFLITTPNLASWSNRAMLLLGFEPGMYEVSFKYRVGKPFNNKRPTQASRHLRLYTYRGLMDHLEVSGFEILRSKGAPVKAMNSLVGFIDRAISLFPSLSSDMIIVARAKLTTL